MAYATIVHYDPPLDKTKAKPISELKKLVLKNDIHIVSFILSYDGFFQLVAKNVNVEKKNKKAIKFIEENEFIDEFEGCLFDVEKNQKFKHYVVGFDHNKLDNLISLIDDGVIEDVWLWKNKQVLFLANVHEDQVFEVKN